MFTEIVGVFAGDVLLFCASEMVWGTVGVAADDVLLSCSLEVLLGVAALVTLC